MIGWQRKQAGTDEIEREVSAIEIILICAKKKYEKGKPRKMEEEQAQRDSRDWRGRDSRVWEAGDQCIQIVGLSILYCQKRQS